MTRDRLIGLGLGIAGGVLILSALQIRRVIPIGIGPGTFPVVLAGLLGLLGVILALRRTPAAAPLVTLPEDRTLAGMAMFAATGLFVLIGFEPLGFVPTGAIAVAAAGWMLGATWHQLLSVALVAPVLTQIVFESVFSVPLPRGIISSLFP